MERFCFLLLKAEILASPLLSFHTEENTKNTNCNMVGYKFTALSLIVKHSKSLGH